MFPSRYGRRNSGGNTRTHTVFVGGVSKLDVIQLVFEQPHNPYRGFVGWELPSGRESYGVVTRCARVSCDIAHTGEGVGVMCV